MTAKEIDMFCNMIPELDAYREDLGIVDQNTVYWTNESKKEFILMYEYWRNIGMFEVVFPFGSSPEKIDEVYKWFILSCEKGEIDSNLNLDDICCIVWLNK